MKIDDLIQRISDIESDLRKISEKYVISNSDGIMLGTMGAFLALSIAEFPRWVSFAGLVALTGKCYHVFYKWKNTNLEYDKIRRSIVFNLSELKKACRELEVNATIMSEPDPKSSILEDKELLPQNISSIIAPLQRLENTSTNFGDDFHKIVRDEIERVLRKYKLEFLDYSEETKECYDVEEADIDEISYASIAVVKKNRSDEDRESPIILKGKVFTPKQ